MTASARALLSGLIDYAGLFPPASLSLEEAVANYAKYLKGEYGWMLGKFIVPAALARELEIAPARISVLLDENFGMDLPLDTSVEFKAANAEEIGKASTLAGFTAYCETDPARPAELIPLLARAGLRAKIRTGGIAPYMIPTTRSVAEFLALCASARVPFKATAGLHHPVRSPRPLTYEPDSPVAVMHGFLNVFLAAALAYSGAHASELLPILDSQNADEFVFEDQCVLWRDRAFTTQHLAAVRSEFATSFGSCSFTEPVEDLLALGIS
jgi:hypothetical protein